MQAFSSALSEQVNKLATSHDDLDNRFITENVIFYGVAEEEN